MVEDLKNNPPMGVVNASVSFPKEAYAVVYPDADSYESEDGIRLAQEECELLFSTPDTVDMLLEALGNPEEASIIIHMLDMPSNVLDAIERRFSSVDEA